MFSVKKVLDLAKSYQSGGTKAIDNAIALLAKEFEVGEMGYLGQYTDSTGLQTLVEIIRGFTIEERLELICLVHSDANYFFSSNYNYDIGRPLKDFFNSISSKHEKILFSFGTAQFLALEVAMSYPKKDIIFESYEEDLVEQTEIYKNFLNLENFSVKNIKNFDDFSVQETDTDDVLGICFPPLGFKGDFRVGPQEINVKQLDAATVMNAALERSHPAVIMTSDSFLFSKGKMSEARGFLVESGRLAGVLSLSSNNSYEKSMIATNLVFLCQKSSRKDKPLYFASTRQSENSLDERVEAAKVLLDNSDKVDLKLNDHHELVAPHDIAKNNYILSPDRYLQSENSSSIEKFNSSNFTVSLGNLVKIIRPIPIKSKELDDAEYQANEIMIGDLEMGQTISLRSTGRDYKRIFLDLQTYMKGKFQVIEPGDILFSIKATIGKASLVNQDDFDLRENNFFTANQNMLILRMNKNSPISREALLSYLSNSVVNSYFQSLATGATLKNLPISYLKELEVPIPGPEVEEQIKANFSQQKEILSRIQMLTSDLYDLQRKTWPNQDLKTEVNLMK